MLGKLVHAAIAGMGWWRFGRKIAVLLHQKEPYMISDQMTNQTSEDRAIWDQYFCAALIAESNLTAPVVGGATHEDRQNLLIERAKALADKMMETRK
ncbi:hypothetical protein PS691_04960 [Pseudomonas fluorescens]|uniref:Uncharacterized protein n=2 Tax=Pseudomonas fluorescens TaxID=294 RepID=A0A5E7EWB0_PSEFL|nr:hypothetical protein PS691_04960 [Pseudomonas fluorescens]